LFNYGGNRNVSQSANGNGVRNDEISEKEGNQIMTDKKPT
jgi:hypothetical protein